MRQVSLFARWWGCVGAWEMDLAGEPVQVTEAVCPQILRANLLRRVRHSSRR